MVKVTQPCRKSPCTYPYPHPILTPPNPPLLPIPIFTLPHPSFLPNPLLLPHSHPSIPSPSLTHYLIPRSNLHPHSPTTLHPSIAYLTPPSTPIPIPQWPSISNLCKCLGSTLDFGGLSEEDLRVRHGESGLIFGHSGNQDACDILQEVVILTLGDLKTWEALEAQIML